MLTRFKNISRLDYHLKTIDKYLGIYRKIILIDFVNK